MRFGVGGLIVEAFGIVWFLGFGVSGSWFREGSYQATIYRNTTIPVVIGS